MGGAFISVLFEQFREQAPVLLVCPVGFALALGLLRRQGRVLILTLLGTGVLVLEVAAVAAVQAYLYQLQVQESSHQTSYAHEQQMSYAHLKFVVGVVGLIIQAIGLALIVAAVFVGRGLSTPIDAEPGRKRGTWTVGSFFTAASLIPGIVVVVVSLWMTGIVCGGMLPRGGGGDPQGGMASGIALEYLGTVGAGSGLVGFALALIGMALSPRRWAVIGLVLNLGFPLLCFCFCLVLGLIIRGL